MKYKHRMVIAYQFNHNQTLVLHLNFKDDNSTKYAPANLVSVSLCNEIPGQDIWGTIYQHGSSIYTIFYCKKEQGEARMLLKGQTATTGQEYVELSEWNINDPVVFYKSTVEEA